MLPTVNYLCSENSEAVQEDDRDTVPMIRAAMVYADLTVEERLAIDAEELDEP